MGNYDRKRTKGRTRTGIADATGRGARLQELIREEVNFLLRNEIRDPRLEDVFVTTVELSVDASCARIWFFALRDDEDEDEDKAEALDHAAGFLRSQIAESLGLKRTPELRFRRDRATRVFDEVAHGAP